MERLPRKFKKKLRKQGLNPIEYLHREQNLEKLFTKNYNDAHAIVQKELGISNN